MKKLLMVSLCGFTFSTFAMVPITTSTDPNALEAAAVAVQQASTYMQQIQNAKSVLDQVKGLQGLQQLQSAGTGLCNLCNQTDQQQLQNYVNSVNEDLCSQFSNATSNTQTARNGLGCFCPKPRNCKKLSS